MAMLILLLNIFAPSSSDVRVLKYSDADRLAGARPRDRGAGRGRQPPGEEGRRAVPHRSDALPARGQHARSAARRHAGLAARAARSRPRARAARSRSAQRDRAARDRRARLGPRPRKRVAAVPRAGRRPAPAAASTWSGRGRRRRAARASSTRRAAPRRRRARESRRWREQQVEQKLGRAGEWRVRAGGADPRAARERAVGAGADHHALALRLLRRQPAAAPGRLRRPACRSTR